MDSPTGSQFPSCQRTGCRQDAPQGTTASTGPGPTEPEKRPLGSSGQARASRPSPSSSTSQDDLPLVAGSEKSVRPVEVSMPTSVRTAEPSQIGGAAVAPAAVRQSERMSAEKILLPRERGTQASIGDPSAALQRSQRGEHLLVVPVHVDLLPGFTHLARAVDQEGGALDAHGFLAVQ